MYIELNWTELMSQNGSLMSKPNLSSNSNVNILLFIDREMAIDIKVRGGKKMQ